MERRKDDVQGIIAQIEHNFTYHPPKPEDAEKYKELRNAAKDFAYLISDLCPDCRERSLAMTNVEQAVFWANASIARRKS